jgi:hypothetical protein
MKRPRGLPRPSREAWDRMAKMAQNQGIALDGCADLILDFARLADEESDLEDEWDGANLQEKLALGRRFSAILREKLRLRDAILKSPKKPSPRDPDDDAWERLLSGADR